MKKRLISLLTAILFISGCNSNTDISPDQENQADDSDNSTTSNSYVDNSPVNNESQYVPSSPMDGAALIWGVNNLGNDFDSALVSDFNKALHKYGCEFDVKFVDLYKEQYFDFSVGTFDLEQAILDYEESNGRLDIIDMAYSEGGIGIEGGQPEEGKKYDFITKGLFAPLDKTAIMHENPFPDEIWNIGLVNGAVYTLPSYTMVHPKVLTFSLNGEYIPQNIIDSYDGSFEGLVDILSELPSPGRFVNMLDKSQTFYETSCVSSEFDFVQSLVLDYETQKAVNPFEYKPFLDFARNFNKAYTNGIIMTRSGANAKFSTYSSNFEYADRDDAGVVAVISDGEISDDFIEQFFYSDPTKFKSFSSSKAYIKNSTSGTIGLSAFSEHKEQVFQLFGAICRDSECAQALQEIGIYRPLCISDIEDFEACGLILSPVAGYGISYTDVEEYFEIKTALYEFYDELCCAENFDAKIEEINTKLKEMGINEFADTANRALIKYGYFPKD
ncbi:MAG: hypothetical protein NC452_16475 [Eubacterium sp.]|nr:hypothetical protein [Eubacterium sp.]